MSKFLKLTTFCLINTNIKNEIHCFEGHPNHQQSNGFLPVKPNSFDHNLTWFSDCLYLWICLIHLWISLTVCIFNEKWMDCDHNEHFLVVKWN